MILLESQNKIEIQENKITSRIITNHILNFSDLADCKEEFGFSDHKLKENICRRLSLSTASR